MKRYLFTLILLVVGCITAMAKMDQTIYVESGDVSILKQKSTATIEFDWENAKWDNDKSLEDQWGADYAQILSECEATFIAQFNKKSKTLKLVTDPAPIHIVFNITGADKHFGVGMRAGWETLISATITVIKDGEQVLELKLIRFEGSKDFSSDDSVARCFKDIATKLVNLK